MKKIKKSKKHIINKLQLDAEEKEILQAFENGKFITVENVDEEIKKAKIAARNTLRKDVRINLRLPRIDVEHIKQKAAYEGLPYQTLIASILHKYAAGHLNIHQH